jgi:hypothetical protein
VVELRLAENRRTKLAQNKVQQQAGGDEYFVSINKVYHWLTFNLVCRCTVPYLLYDFRCFFFFRFSTTMPSSVLHPAVTMISVWFAFISPLVGMRGESKILQFCWTEKAFERYTLRRIYRQERSRARRWKRRRNGKRKMRRRNKSKQKRRRIRGKFGIWTLTFVNGGGIPRAEERK